MSDDPELECRDPGSNRHADADGDGDKDILAASVASAPVPDLVGKDHQAVLAALAGAAVRGELHPREPKDGARVVSQDPAAHDPAPPGATVRVTFAGPVPDLTGMSYDDARIALEDVKLVLVADPPKPPDAAEVTDQTPKAGETVPLDQNVTATFG